MNELEKTKQQLLIEKWKPILDQMGIRDPEKIKWMAEYAEFHKQNEKMELLNEETKDVENAEPKDIEWQEVSFELPIARRVYAQTVRNKDYVEFNVGDTVIVTKLRDNNGRKKYIPEYDVSDASVGDIGIIVKCKKDDSRMWYDYEVDKNGKGIVSLYYDEIEKYEPEETEQFEDWEDIDE